MSKLLGFFTSLAINDDTRKPPDDDVVSRLSRSYTPTMLVFLALLISTRQYVGDSIECWAPGHFNDNYVAYTNKICWASNTYHQPRAAGSADSRATLIASDAFRPHRKMVNYYQWVPMFLLGEALLFYLPGVLWRILNRKSGVEIAQLVDVGREMDKMDDRERVRRYMVACVDRLSLI